MLDDLISRATLEDLAGTAAFQRGEECFSIGAVGRICATDDKVTARVEDTETYKVELRDDDARCRSAVRPETAEIPAHLRGQVHA